MVKKTEGNVSDSMKNKHPMLKPMKEYGGRSFLRNVMPKEKKPKEEKIKPTPKPVKRQKIKKGPPPPGVCRYCGQDWRSFPGAAEIYFVDGFSKRCTDCG